MKHPSASSVSRRRFIQGLGVAGTAIALPAASRAAAESGSPGSSEGKPRNIIFLVVDGMGMGTLGLAYHWQLQERGEVLNWMQLYNHPGVVTGLQDTASANSPVTDSAAAASAWGCGQRVPNRHINTDAAGKKLTPLYTYAREAGKATGLVSTCRITHATPAGFVANVKHRNEEELIARQYLEREVDVILGGGTKFFSAELRSDYREAGYTVLESGAELSKAGSAGKTKRVLGLFSEDHVPYAIDREKDPELKDVPGLVEMTRAALKLLEASENGFILQVEAGRVDHAGHANDPAAILREQLEYDSVITQVQRFQEAHPDTLVIVTTDHGTGGCQLDGVGSGYVDTPAALASLNNYTASIEAIVRRLRAGEPIPETLANATGRTPSAEDLSAVRSLVEDNAEGYGLANGLADLLYGGTGVGWSSHNHTSECVETLAYGPGSAGLKPFMLNNELFGLLRAAL